jgi:hypothetical protein
MYSASSQRDSAVVRDATSDGVRVIQVHNAVAQPLALLLPKSDLTPPPMIPLD